MTLDQLKTNLQAAAPNTQWLINAANHTNVLYTDLHWLDQIVSKPSSQDLGF